MDNDNKNYRGSIATEISVFDFVDKEIFESRNKHKKWQYRRYPEINDNFIVVSKDGTIGETLYKIGGLIIAIPCKKDKQIINNDKSGVNAKWERTRIPKDFLDLENKYAEDIANTSASKIKLVRDWYKSERLILFKKHKKFIEKEWEKRKNGIFIKIDEKIFYLTGSNYMFLNYYYLTDSDMHPLFRTTAVYTWLHWEAVKADSSLWGEIRFKSRRVAWSSEAASIALDELTKTRYGNIPIVSERKELAKELFQSKIVDAFKYYPTYFKPILNNPNELVKTTLEITHDTAKRETSKITTYPTKVTAYDSTRVKPFAINDEIFKPEDMDFSDFRSRHKHCYNKSANLTPKGKFGSTVGDKATNVSSATYEWDNANPNKRGKNGSTTTGLCALFVDTCFTDAENAMFDEWGYPIVNNPEHPILNEIGQIVEFGSISIWSNQEEKLKKEGKKSELNSFYRNTPRTIEQALRDEGGINNDFDIDNLNNHLDYLEKLPEYEMNEMIKRGNLAWEGEEYKSKVIWQPNTKGKFITTWIPDKDMQNLYSMQDFHGKKVQMPSNNHIGVFGVDSYDIIGTTEDGSDGTIVGYTKFSMTGAPTKSFFLIYKERPKKRNDFYDDVIKACVFYGFYALIESNKSRLLEYMYDKGYTGYSMRRQDKKWKDLKEYEKKWGGIPSSTPVIEDQASLLKDYIVDNIGQNLENECKVYHIPLIKEWIKFNLNKRKKFDLGVASGMAIMGAQYKVKKRGISPFIKQKNDFGLELFGA